MLYFFNGFFPIHLRISFDGQDDKFFSKRMALKWSTANNISAIRRENLLCFLSLDTLNSLSLKQYSELKDTLSYPLNSIFAVQSYNKIYGEHRFVLVAQAAEGIIEEKYDHKLANPSFQNRIKFLFNPLLVADSEHGAALFSSVGIDENTHFKLIMDTRHFYSHLAKKRKCFERGEELISEYWILSIAIRMFILQEIGVSYNESLFKTNTSSIVRWINEHRRSHKPTSS